MKIGTWCKTYISGSIIVHIPIYVVECRSSVVNPGFWGGTNKKKKKKILPRECTTGYWHELCALWGHFRIFFLQLYNCFCFVEYLLFSPVFIIPIRISCFLRTMENGILL